MMTILRDNRVTSLRIKAGSKATRHLINQPTQGGKEKKESLSVAKSNDNHQAKQSILRSISSVDKRRFELTKATRLHTVNLAIMQEKAIHPQTVQFHLVVVFFSSMLLLQVNRVQRLKTFELNEPRCIVSAFLCNEWPAWLVEKEGRKSMTLSDQAIRGTSSDP